MPYVILFAKWLGLALGSYLALVALVYLVVFLLGLFGREETFCRPGIGQFVRMLVYPFMGEIDAITSGPGSLFLSPEQSTSRGLRKHEGYHRGVSWNYAPRWLPLFPWGIAVGSLIHMAVYLARYVWGIAKYRSMYLAYKNHPEEIAAEAAELVD